MPVDAPRARFGDMTTAPALIASSNQRLTEGSAIAEVYESSPIA